MKNLPNQLGYYELDKVVGGGTGQLAEDSRYLNVLLRGTDYYRCDRYGSTKIAWSVGAENDVLRAWASLGIKVTSDFAFTNNHYKLNGKEISRQEAWAHAEELAGKHLKKSDWNF